MDKFLIIKTFQSTSELSEAIGKMLPRNPSQPLRKHATDSTYHSIASAHSPSRNTLATSNKPIRFLQVIIAETVYKIMPTFYFPEAIQKLFSFFFYFQIFFSVFLNELKEKPNCSKSLILKGWTARDVSKLGNNHRSNCSV